MNEDDKFYHLWEITPQLYNDFIRISNDRNPMHTDSTFAKKHGFETKVVHGNILNVFISYAIGELLPIKDLVIIDQSIKYKNPIYIGNKINFELIVTSKIDSVNIIKFKFKFHDKLKSLVFASGNVTIKRLL